MSNIQSIIQRGLAAAEDIFDQLDTPAEPDAGIVAVEHLSGDVQFSRVAFRYPGAQSDAILDISFSAAEGTSTAIVGRSGSGKSTLVKLLARFYEPNAGAITVAGQDIASIKLADYRRSLGFVPQQITLFSESVANNIALGDSAQAERAAIEQAATWANAQEFIETLEHGFDTEIGEQGVGLSGGQRQRIAIARALLKDAPILILDEATSALDNESEALIQRSLQEHAVGKTTFVIAHRLSTIENADQVLVMDQGRLVAQGSHADLIESNDVYRSLYQQGFSDD